MERRIYTIEEAIQMLGLSRATVYKLVKEGKIPALRIGRRLVIPKAAFEKMLDGATIKEE